RNRQESGRAGDCRDDGIGMFALAADCLELTVLKLRQQQLVAGCLEGAPAAAGSAEIRILFAPLALCDAHPRRFAGWRTNVPKANCAILTRRGQRLVVGTEPNTPYPLAVPIQSEIHHAIGTGDANCPLPTGDGEPKSMRRDRFNMVVKASCAIAKLE